MVRPGARPGKHHSFIFDRSAFHGGRLFYSLPAAGRYDHQLASLCTALAFHRWDGVLLDRPADLAGAENHGDPSNRAVPGLSGLSLHPQREHETEPPVWVCYSAALDRCHAAGDEREPAGVEDLLRPCIPRADCQLSVHIRVHDRF